MNKEDRFALYRKVLNYLTNPENRQYGICYAIHRVDETASFYASDYSELMDNKPREIYDEDYWFKPGNVKPRIKILNKILNDKETSKKMVP